LTRRCGPAPDGLTPGIAMKLVLLLQRNTWFVDHDQAWFRLQNDDDINLGLSALPLSIANEFDMVEQPHQRGTATIERESKGMISIVCREQDDTVVDTVKLPLDIKCLVSVDWLTKPFRDGWMDAISRIQTDNVKRLVLKAYLPPVNGSEGKMLKLTNDDDGEEVSVFLKRGEQSEIPLIEDGLSCRTTMTLSCEPESINSSTDIRQLGFILLDEIVEAA